MQVSVPEVDVKELKREESKRAAANIRRKLDLENTRYCQEEQSVLSGGKKGNVRRKVDFKNTR